MSTQTSSVNHSNEYEIGVKRKTGRKHKAFISSRGETIPGLAHDTDGKWRIVETGQKFREANEELAVLKAKKILHELSGGGLVRVGVANTDPAFPEAMKAAIKAQEEQGVRFDLQPTGNTHTLFKAVPEAVLWPWLRKLLIEQPDYVALKTGIPQIRGLATLEIPKTGIPLAELVNLYQNENGSNADSKKRAVDFFNQLITLTGASTVPELTTERLLKFKKSIETNPKYTSGEVKSWIYGRIKAVISFGLKSGLDEMQIRSLQGRCKVLWTRTKKLQYNPTPISREHFQTLFNGADEVWQAMLLVGLNCCLHMKEVLMLEWSKIDLEKGTHTQIRVKTEEDQIPRAAVLWPETIAALKKIKRTGLPLVFVSPHGKMYNRTSRGNCFADLRTRVGVPDEVTFDWIRDGCWTAACNGKGVDERHAKVLGGHACGMSARYVLSNPEIVKDACQAVYECYGPFNLKA